MTQYTPRPSDRFIPWYLIGFFGFFVVLLGWFGWIAIRSYSGEVGSDAYETGRHYNATLEQAVTEAKLGWKGTLTATPSAADPRHIDLRYTLQDAQGVAIEKAIVHVYWMRATQEGFDQATTLSVDSKGGYTGYVNVPLRGVWNVYVHATHGKDAFHQSQTIVLP